MNILLTRNIPQPTFTLKVNNNKIVSGRVKQTNKECDF